MNGVAVCYSLGGNNERVAKGVAERLDLVKVSEWSARWALTAVECQTNWLTAIGL